VKKRILVLVLALSFVFGIGVQTVSAVSFMPNDAPKPVSVFFASNGHVYASYENEKLTWKEAQAFCERYGGYLATITSSLEQNYVKEVISLAAFKNQYWIGLTKDSGTWEWVTGEAVSYTNWDSGEPNAKTRGDGKVESYGQIQKKVNPALPSSRVYSWNDNFNDNNHPTDSFYTSDTVGFICEWGTYEVPKPPTPTLSGFEVMYDGWSVVNSRAGFSYPKNYAIPSSRYTEVYADIPGHIINIVDGKWGGNCFGMAASAVLYYEGIIDLKRYFSKSGDCLNLFGYDVRAEKTNALNQTNEVVALIERLQVSQMSKNCDESELFASGNQSSRFNSLIDYLRGNDPTPLVITISNGLSGHALVTNTAASVWETTFNGEGGYYGIPVYDPNYPYDGTGHPNPAEWYGGHADSILYVNPTTGAWFYCVNRSTDKWWGGTWDMVPLFSNINFYDVTKFSNSFINGTLLLGSLDDTVFADVSAEAVTLTHGDKVFSVNMAEETVTSDVEYHVWSGYIPDEENSHFDGRVVFGTGEITASGGSDAEVTYRMADKTISITTDDASSYTVDAEENKIKLHLSENASFEVSVTDGDGEEYSAVSMAGTAEGGELLFGLSDDGAITASGDAEGVAAELAVESDGMAAVTFAPHDITDLDGVRIDDRERGDLNGDKKLDIDDALLLFQHSILPDVYDMPYIGSVDFDENEKVDIDDALLLFQHSILPDVYPIPVE